MKCEYLVLRENTMLVQMESYVELRLFGRVAY